MLRLLIIILYSVVFVVESTRKEGDTCTVKANSQPGNCTLLADCTTLEDSTPKTVYGMRGGKQLVCCPFPAAPDISSEELPNDEITEKSPVTTNQNRPDDSNSQEGDECIVETTKKYGKCSFVNDCKELSDPTEVTSCGYQDRRQIICCPLPTPEGRMCGQQKCISERKCDEYNSTLSCIVGMVTGGEKTEPKEFPHMALLGYKDRTASIYWMCGGSLISDQYILTAAHCVQRIDVYISGKKKQKIINLARLGEHDYAKNNSEIQDYRFTIIQHEDYNSNTKLNDIALLKLNEEVNFSEFIRPACLPTTFAPHRPDGIVTGWGTTDFMGPTSSILLKAALRFNSYNDCSRIYKSQDLTLDNITQICAVDKEKDACQGDSGGPLQTKHPLYDCMHTVYGVISFGILCGRNVPGVYVRVFAYLDWIENEVWKTT